MSEPTLTQQEYRGRYVAANWGEFLRPTKPQPSDAHELLKKEKFPSPPTPPPARDWGTPPPDEDNFVFPLAGPTGKKYSVPIRGSCVFCNSSNHKVDDNGNISCGPVGNENIWNARQYAVFHHMWIGARDRLTAGDGQLLHGTEERFLNRCNVWCVKHLKGHPISKEHEAFLCKELWEIMETVLDEPQDPKHQYWVKMSVYFKHFHKVNRFINPKQETEAKPTLENATTTGPSPSLPTSSESDQGQAGPK